MLLKVGNHLNYKTLRNTFVLMKADCLLFVLSFFFFKANQYDLAIFFFTIGYSESVSC